MRSSYSTGIRPLSYFDRRAGFASGAASPRDFLEACLEIIEARDGDLRAWTVLAKEAARKAADESADRWLTGAQLSPIDGMPIGVKDNIDTADMPTELGCAAFRGRQPHEDAPLVAALRAAGAIVLGKTAMTELAGMHPGPARNPFDRSMSPGGSSSGSAAAVAARMVPAAIGTQVGGSITRPASYCGTFSLKPSQGAINRGGSDPYSIGTFGVLAGSLEDAWLVARQIAGRCGGDAGYLSLSGPAELPRPSRAATVAVMETPAFPSLPDNALNAFGRLLDQLAARGVRILRRRDHPALEAFETCLAKASPAVGRIVGWEGRPTLQSISNSAPDRLSARARNSLARGCALTVADYEDALRFQQEMRRAYNELMQIADAVVSPSSPGPAPAWVENGLDDTEPPHPTGDPVFNVPSSLLGAPAISLPLMSVGGMPMGLQLMGRAGQDAGIASLARWVLEEIAPVKL